MQNVQTANFINRFLTDASQFGLHLDTESTGPFPRSAEMAVAKVINLEETYVLVFAFGHVLVMDGSDPERWTSNVVATVEELSESIKLRRAVQLGRWN